MKLSELEGQIRQLIELEPTESPMLSCYLNLSKAEPFVRTKFTLRAQSLRNTVHEDALPAFDEAVGKVEDFLFGEIQRKTQGAAVFARGGSSPFYLAMEFEAELPTWISTGSIPNVYHLVEFKDSYHRFIILLSLPTSARIIEVNLGKITEEIWSKRPESRQQIVAGWSRAHFQHYRDLQTDQFIKEKINVLDRLMSAGGHSHLILAGNPQMLVRIRQVLPKHLASKVIDSVEAYRRENIADIVTETIGAFLRQEERESRANAERLMEEFLTGGLAVAGTEETLRALEWGQADVLIMSRDFDPHFTVKETMVRLAEKSGCKIEIVAESQALAKLGGVGCLLRYSIP